MKIISIIEDGQIIEKILRHLGIWDIRNHDPPPKKSVYVFEINYDDSYSQLLPTDYWLQ